MSYGMADDNDENEEEGEEKATEVIEEERSGVKE